MNVHNKCYVAFSSMRVNETVLHTYVLYPVLFVYLHTFFFIMWIDTYIHNIYINIPWVGTIARRGSYYTIYVDHGLLNTHGLLTVYLVSHDVDGTPLFVHASHACRGVPPSSVVVPTHYLLIN